MDHNPFPQKAVRYPKKIEKKMDAATSADALYFLMHPNAEDYERPYVDGEFYPMHLPPGTLVTVVQVQPGVRQRLVPKGTQFIPYPQTPPPAHKKMKLRKRH